MSSKSFDDEVVRIRSKTDGTPRFALVLGILVLIVVAGIFGWGYWMATHSGPLPG